MKNLAFYIIQVLIILKKLFIPIDTMKSKKIQDICYGVAVGEDSQNVTCGESNISDNDYTNKLDNYFDDPTRFFTFDEGYYDGYSRTKGDK